jgi:hypothetical protein
MSAAKVPVSASIGGWNSASHAPGKWICGNQTSVQKKAAPIGVSRNVSETSQRHFPPALFQGLKICQTCNKLACKFGFKVHIQGVKTRALELRWCVEGRKTKRQAGEEQGLLFDCINKNIYISIHLVVDRWTVLGSLSNSHLLFTVSSRT